MKYLTILALTFFTLMSIAEERNIDRLIKIESSYSGSKINIKEDAVGILQIRKIYVDDCNRILKYPKFTYNDRYSEKKSIEMFKIYTSHYGEIYRKKHNKAPTWEILVRIHNGGPQGYKKESTLNFWNRVENLR